jgi:hypothetical protein
VGFAFKITLEYLAITEFEGNLLSILTFAYLAKKMAKKRQNRAKMAGKPSKMGKYSG